jgi:hypothetical protein
MARPVLRWTPRAGVHHRVARSDRFAHVRELSLAIIDLGARTTIAYTPNRVAGGTAGDLRGFALATAFWA